MNIKKILNDMFDELRRHYPDIPMDDFSRIWGKVEERVATEPPPKIAVIGATGVGKSATINALFGAGHEVSHTQAQTQEEAAVELKIETLEGEKGALIVYDMPGLGESQAKRSQHLATYRRVLQEVDVALWILDANYREIESIQNYLTNEIRDMNPKLVEPMVFALNKVDLVHPGETAWHPLANLPSEEQERNIKARLYDVQVKIREAVPGWTGTVIGYSATKRYNLPQLFAVMLESVPKKRQWVVASRKALADFLQFVHPALLPPDRVPEQPMVPQTREQKAITKVLEGMSQEEFKEVAQTKEDLMSWLRKMGYTD